MNRKQKAQIKQAREISYQEAWNKIAEYMNAYHELSFMVTPWSTVNASDINSENKYSLRTLENGEYVVHFVADKERRDNES